MSRKRKTATQPGRRSKSKPRTQPPWVLDLSLAEFRVSNEQTTVHTPEVEQIVTQATDCLKARDGLDAERLFRQALVLEPDEPDLWNNLAATLGLQRREAEALAIIREVHGRFPDYLFARTALARQAMLQGELDLAVDLLEPLHRRRNFHVSEWNALCEIQVSLLLLRGDLALARTWYEMWADSQPDHPALATYRPYFLPDP